MKEKREEGVVVGRERVMLAFMQNQWVRDPDGLRRILARHDEDFRRRMIAKLLFAGCVSGMRLKAALGDLCTRIVWDEASPVITGKSNGCPPADIDHMTAAIETLKPAIVLTFGRIATNGLLECLPRIQGRHRFLAFSAPHPAARHATVGEELAQIAAHLRTTESSHGTQPGCGPDSNPPPAVEVPR